MRARAAVTARGWASPPTRSSCCFSAACTGSNGSICSPRRSPIVRATQPERPPGARGSGRAASDPRVWSGGWRATRRSVHVIGTCQGADKWALLNDADVTVQCSDSESFGLAVVESLASGVPAVVTRTCPWLRSRPRAAACGWSRRRPAIAAALNDLAGDPARARADGRARRGVRARPVRLGRDRAANGQRSTPISPDVPAPPVIVLTPNLCGRDGISRLARLVIGALGDASVLALHEPAAMTRFERAGVRGAGGRSSRSCAAALRGAAAANRHMPVIVTHLHLAPAALAFAARGAPLTAHPVRRRGVDAGQPACSAPRSTGPPG